MGSVNKKLAAALRPPDWASFFTFGQYVDFMRLLTDDLRGRGLSFKEDDGFAIVRRGGGKAQRCSLLNIAQMCHTRPAEGWQSAIAEFLDTVLKIDSQIEHMVSGLSDIQQVRNKIKLRLHSAAYHETPGASELLIRDEADGLVSLMVCDMKFANFSVPRMMIKGWGMSEDEAFQLALENTHKQEEVHYTVMPRLPNGVVLEGIEGQSNYGATHLLCLDRHVKNVSGLGVVAGVPNRHLIFLHRLQDKKFMEAMGDLWRMTEHAYRDGPGSISKDLYWWRPVHGLRRLPVVQRTDRLEIVSDSEFYREVIMPLQEGN